METENKTLSRRDFFRFAGGAAFVATMPRDLFKEKAEVSQWPSLEKDELPQQMERYKRVIELLPETSITENGYLSYDGRRATSYPTDVDGFEPGPDKELKTEVIATPISWIVVLQKPYGHLENNSEDYSDTAHFLVEEDEITQTKPPSPDGNPQVAWQVSSTNWDEYNPFATAMNTISYDEKYNQQFRPALSKVFFEEPKISLFRRVIVVKVDGEIGDKEEAPSDKLMANLLSTLRSLKRYDLGPWDMVDNSEVYGHNRELRKDVGVKTMAEIRHCLGIVSLLDGDDKEKELVFGEFQKEGEDKIEAVKRYFRANRDYLMRVVTPKELQEWDARTKFWYFMDSLEGKESVPIADDFCPPVEKDSGGGTRHLEEEWSLHNLGERTGTFHLGHDYNIGFGNEDEGKNFMSIATGVVAFAGWTYNGLGQVIIIKHRLEDGRQIYSRYGHTKEVYIKEGDNVEMGQVIGQIGRTGQEDKENFYAHLHLDLAYSTTYEQTMRDNPHYYPNGSRENADRLFADPVTFIEEHKKAEVNEELLDPIKFRGITE